MVMCRLAIVLVAAFLCTCCGTDRVPTSPIFDKPPTGQQVWVGKVFSGGAQCTNDAYTPPDMNRTGNLRE
jgi:hypothetical protein